VISEQLVDLSRLQFAATALYHFLFVPLTVGMVWLLVIMESVYVMTGNVIWKDMTRYWGKLFGINFALGVTTVSPWNSSSVPTGRTTPTTWATSSVRRWPSKA